MEQKEIFKDIPSFEGYYQVSNLGRVKSCERVLDNGKKRHERIMKGYTNKNGYRVISLSDNGTMITKLIHRLVAEVFIPNPENKPDIDHINAIRDDNRVDNLRWCTQRENVHYCMNLGRRYLITPEKSINSRMVAKIDKNGNEIALYPSMGEAHRQNPKASVSKISAVCRGERNFAGGFRWEFRSELPKHMQERNMKEKGIAIPICQYDKEGNFIAEYKSIIEAYRISKVHFTCIKKSLDNGYITMNGYYFKYKNNVLESK